MHCRDDMQRGELRGIYSTSKLSAVFPSTPTPSAQDCQLIINWFLCDITGQFKRCHSPWPVFVFLIVSILPAYKWGQLFILSSKYVASYNPLNGNYETKRTETNTWYAFLCLTIVDNCVVFGSSYRDWTSLVVDLDGRLVSHYDLDYVSPLGAKLAAWE